MSSFEYSAYNSTGKQIQGTINADSSRHARRLLKDQKLQPLNVHEAKPVSQKTGQKKRRKAGKVNAFDLSLLLRQQSILIQSGLPLEEAMRMTIEQAETERLSKIVSSWHIELIEGRSFSEALRRSPYSVPENVIAGIGVGEESGHLHQVLLRLADELESNAENKKTLKRALIYPATLIVTSIVVVAVMMIWVVPKITVIFTNSNRELPFITKVIIGLSDFTQHYGIIVVVLIAIAFFSFRQACKDPQRLRRWHKFLLGTPGLGRWIHMANIADWSRSLGILLSNGVPILTALTISTSVVNNIYLKDKLEAVKESMRRGNSLHKALAENLENSGFLVHMTSSGEASSQLHTMLLRVADYYSLRLKSAVEIFLKIMNPLLIVVMGIIILCVVAAVMLPIMDMNNMINT